MADPGCTYCRLGVETSAGPERLVAEDDHWTVWHGPPESTRAGGLKIVSRRHFVDFVDMADAESASFGPLLRDLDGAVRSVTGAERVHLVSTRDRVQHFHAWLYPRHSTDALRGTAFIDAPQSSSAAEADDTTRRLRDLLS